MGVLRKALRLTVIVGLGVGVWKLVKGRAQSPWKIGGEGSLATAGGPPSAVITPPEPKTAPTAATAEPAEGPGAARPAPTRPPRPPAKTGPARKAPTGRAEGPPGERTWVAANEGVCPPSHPVKAKLASKIFHVPGARNYSRTRADRCYPDEAAATADGLRPPMR